MAQGAGQHENRQGRLVALVIAGRDAALDCCAMAWSQVGSCWAVCNIDRFRCIGSVYLGYGGVSAHVAAPPETREMRRVC